MVTLSHVVYMVLGEAGFMRFFPELFGKLSGKSTGLQSLLQWNTHIFHKEIVKLSVGRVCPASPLTDVVKSPSFFHDPLFRPIIANPDHLQDQILVVNFRGQVVDPSVLFFFVALKERIFCVN